MYKNYFPKKYFISNKKLFYFVKTHFFRILFLNSYNHFYIYNVNTVNWKARIKWLWKHWNLGHSYKNFIEANKLSICYTIFPQCLPMFYIILSIYIYIQALKGYQFILMKGRSIHRVEWFSMKPGVIWSQIGG